MYSHKREWLKLTGKTPSGCQRLQNYVYFCTMRKIAAFTGTRADWGLLSPICRALADRTDTDVTVVATNMHLSPRFGHTIDEIRADGFSPVELPMDADADTDAARVEAMGACMAETGRLLERLRPDVALILGDRFEMLAIASACLMMRVPVAHIAGGEISEGAIDDSIRHAITKMSALHLTATDVYRRRVMAMGEDPRMVVNTGAIGVWNLLHDTALATPGEVREFTGMDIDRRTVIVTYHPATLDDADIDARVDALTGALDDVEGLRAVITYPNNDARGRRVIERLKTYAAMRLGKVALVASLGRRRYLTAIRMAGAVVGNSSSGIVEVPSAGTPTVDIGIRQCGRISAPSVIHCGDSRDEISAAIRTALGDDMQRLAAEAHNPYARPDTLKLIVEAVVGTPLELLRRKTFHDITPLQ